VVLVAYLRHGSHKNTPPSSSSTVTCVSVAAGARLPGTQQWSPLLAPLVSFQASCHSIITDLPGKSDRNLGHDIGQLDKSQTEELQTEKKEQYTRIWRTAKITLHILCKRVKEGKAIPTIDREGPQDCETSRFPHFLDNRLTDGGEVVSPTHRPPFTPKFLF
jgi:hypothetical protein